MLRAMHIVLRGKSRAGPAMPRGFAGNRGYSTALNSQRLAGKVAVITGGASGIGKATAEEFVKNGAKVVLADVQDDLGHALAAKLGADSASYTRCDVTDEAQVAASVDLAVSRHGNLDIMFNNAGILGSLARPPLASLDLADFDTVMAMMPAPPPRSPRRPSPSPTLCVITSNRWWAAAVEGVAARGTARSRVRSSIGAA
ncbi:momilactone A synthase-like [Lolium perenne]|uniref:momilactone A synthase-like n=1 Tax=Lolium perenne TaxID=4522 RepID=UPI003A999F13